MISSVMEIEYFTIIVADRPGEARKILEFLSERSVNLLALTAFPWGEGESRIDFFPDDLPLFREAAEDAGMEVTGPRKAFLIQGEDRIGAFWNVHLKLSNAGINVHACNGVVDGSGRFGYVVWVEPDDHDEAAEVLRTSDWMTIQPSPRK